MTTAPDVFTVKEVPGVEVKVRGGYLEATPLMRFLNLPDRFNKQNRNTKKIDGKLYIHKSDIDLFLKRCKSPSRIKLLCKYLKIAVPPGCVTVENLQQERDDADDRVIQELADCGIQHMQSSIEFRVAQNLYIEGYKQLPWEIKNKWLQNREYWPKVMKTFPNMRFNAPEAEYIRENFPWRTDNMNAHDHAYVDTDTGESMKPFLVAHDALSAIIFKKGFFDREFPTVVVCADDLMRNFGVPQKAFDGIKFVNLVKDYHMEVPPHRQNAKCGQRLLSDECFECSQCVMYQYCPELVDNPDQEKFQLVQQHFITLDDFDQVWPEREPQWKRDRICELSMDLWRSYEKNELEVPH